MAQFETNLSEISTIRSYKTLKALQKGLEHYGINEYRHLVVNLENGRFTAIFAASEAAKHGYLGVFSQFGFITFG